MNKHWFFFCVTFQITIDDCNDEIPQFEKTLYTWNVPEDSQVNTLFTTNLDKLSATDDDEVLTPNSQIKYALDASVTSVFGMFTEDNGKIRTIAFLDRETIPVHSFDCFAKDQGTLTKKCRRTKQNNGLYWSW